MTMVITDGWAELESALKERFNVAQMDRHLGRLGRAGKFRLALLLHGEHEGTDYGNVVVLAFPWIHDIEFPGPSGHIRTSSIAMQSGQVSIDDDPAEMRVQFEHSNGSGMYWMAKTPEGREGLLLVLESIQEWLVANRASG